MNMPAVGMGTTPAGGGEAFWTPVGGVLEPLPAYTGIKVGTLEVTGTAILTGNVSVGTTISLPNGTAGAPPLRFTNSTTTGLFRQAADVIGIAIAGVEAFRVSATLFDLGVNGLAVWGTAVGASDLGLARTGVGVLEINNGVAGTLRDGRARALTLVRGTITDPVDTLTITGTFNDAGDTFRGVEIDYTVTAAGALSTMFRVTKAGTAVLSVFAAGFLLHAAGTLPAGGGAASQSAATFNDGASTYYGLNLVVTNSASAAASRGIRLEVGGVEVFSVGLGGDVNIVGGANIVLSTSIGTKIGTGTTQRLGFFNATPVPQLGAVANPAGGAVVDTECRTQLSSLLARVRTIGLLAP